MMQIRLYALKLHLKERLKYSHSMFGMLLNAAIFIVALILFYAGKSTLAFKLCGEMFRTNGYGAVLLPRLFLSLTMGKALLNSPKFTATIQNYIDELKVAPGKEKIVADPTRMLTNMAIVVRKWTPEGKGILIIKYSYYFPLFLKKFDIDSVTSRYHIVLEPSWAGYFDLDILSYCTLAHSVFVMTYEERDKNLIEQLDSNLKSIEVGPNWWVDFDNFKPQNVKRDIDVIVIASWSSFKRHHYILKALVTLKKSMTDYSLKVAFVGYAGDISSEFMRSMVKYYDMQDSVEFYETVPTEQVANLLMRSKVNLLWSRFEGNNRSIIEGMFCDTPVVIREGHNFGYKYPYINSLTGVFSSENELPQILESIISGKLNFSPRDYVKKQHNYLVAIKQIEDAIKEFETSSELLPNCDGKINRLSSMSYLDTVTAEKYIEDYHFLKSTILK
jgi:glycosyltransferase involved in cell wall biosynthesis